MGTCRTATTVRATWLMRSVETSPGSAIPKELQDNPCPSSCVIANLSLLLVWFRSGGRDPASRSGSFPPFKLRHGTSVHLVDSNVFCPRCAELAELDLAPEWLPPVHPPRPPPQAGLPLRRVGFEREPPA